MKALRQFFAWRDPAVLDQQVKLFLPNFLIAMVTFLLVAIFAALVMRHLVPAPPLNAWLLGYCIGFAADMVLYYCFMQRLKSSKSVAYIILLGVAINGLSWASFVGIVAAYGEPAALSYTIAMVASICAGASGLSASLVLAAFAHMIGPVLVIALCCYWVGGPIYLAFVPMPFVYFVVMMVIARSAENGACRAIELQYQNLELVKRLREETYVAVAATKEADAARHEAEQANIDKSKFLAAASHDLRQPLHAMGLFVEALARSDLTPAQQEVLGHVRAASAATNEMLTTLLDFSRLEAGVVLPRPRVFALQEMLLHLEQEFGLIADEKHLFFRLRDTTAAVYADPTLVDLVLRNLISNALRYTETGGVLVACRKRRQNGMDYTLVEVWDTGIGIAQDQQIEIFREFHQLGNSERDRRKGLGLGLAIVQRLAKTMGVRVELSSNFGRGSVFRLWLPTAAGLIEPMLGELESVPASTLDVRGLRVLVVDDEEPVRLGMQKLLESWGCVAHTTECIEDAIDTLNTLALPDLPKVVLSDYRLRNGVTGGDVLAELRQYYVRRHCPHSFQAVIITGDTAPERLREAQNLDAVLLHKPLSADMLLSALQTVVQ